jgi:hypothetical protein
LNDRGAGRGRFFGIFVGQLADHDARIGDRTDSNADVEPFLDHVDGTIRRAELDLQARIARSQVASRGTT